ncbi:hypothetical protein V6Z11_A10G121200 [Gossypium hirsutum]
MNTINSKNNGEKYLHLLTKIARPLVPIPNPSQQTRTSFLNPKNVLQHVLQNLVRVRRLELRVTRARSHGVTVPCLVGNELKIRRKKLLPLVVLRHLLRPVVSHKKQQKEDNRSLELKETLTEKK